MKWTDLPGMSSARFTWENSAKRQQLTGAWGVDTDGSLTQMASGYKPIGYTESPPFPPGWEHDGSKWIAIMYECADFSLVWWHHMIEIDKDKLVAGLVAEVGKMAKITVNLRSCARCGGDHEALEFELLKGRLQLEYSHWAICPEEEQPVFLKLRKEERYVYGESVANKSNAECASV